MKSISTTTAAQEQRIKADPLATTIVHIMSAMRADYGRVFVKQFEDEEIITLFKRRLYQKLKGLDIEAIVEGYELCTERNVKFCPTVPEIVASALEAIKRHKKRDENKAEAERVSALPPPTISCDPIAMLAKARNAGMQEPETAEENKARRADLLKDHEARLVLAGSKIKRIYTAVEQSCMHAACRKAGGISNGTMGHGNYYCAEHYREA